MPVLTDLTIKQPEVASPIQTIGGLLQLRGQQGEIALRNAQLAQANAATSNIQAEAQQRDRDLRDQNTFQEAMKDPAISARVHTGDFSDLESKMQPKNLDLLRQSQTAYQNNLLTQTKTQNELRGTALDEITDTALGLKSLTGPDGKPDLARINAQLPGAFQRLNATGAFKRAGITNMRDVPTALTDTSQLDDFLAGIGGAKAASDKVLAQQKTAAEVKNANAGAAKDTATADLDNFKLSLMKGLTGPNVASSVDALIDRTKYPQANADAHAAAQLAANSGDPAKVTEAVQEIYDEQVGSVQKAAALIPSKVAEQKALIPGEVSKAGAIAQAEIPARVAGAVQTQQALAKLSPDAFATIPDPVSRREAMNESDKIDKEYSDKLTASQQLLDTIHAAQAGNKAAPGVIPIEQVRSVLANGRVNAAELRAVSSQAGSLMDRLEGWANKNTKGEPNPPDILRDMVSLATIQQQAAAQTRDAGLQRLKKRGVDTSKLAAPSVGAANAGTVNMRAPDGTAQLVPADQVDHYLKLGATKIP